MTYIKVIVAIIAIVYIYCYWSKPSNKNSKNGYLDYLREEDYYGILGVQDDVSMEDIRIAFRRLSQAHHPDENLNDQVGATKRFAKISEAYQILSDRDSRAVYDFVKALEKFERSSCHSTFDPGTSGERFHPFSENPHGASSSHGHHNADDCPGCIFRARWGIKYTDLQLYFLHGLYIGMHDGPTGFFALYRYVFDELIVQDECKFTNRNPSSFPSFGYSNWPYKALPVKTSKKKKNKGKGLPHAVKRDAKTFYDFWTTFTSQKGFGWAEGRDVSSMPKSPMKDWFTAENKACEQAARDQYNETVRNLARLLLQSDPRR